MPSLRERSVPIEATTGGAVTVNVTAPGFAWTGQPAEAHVYGPGGVPISTFAEVVNGDTLTLTLSEAQTAALGVGKWLWALKVAGTFWVGGRFSLAYPGSDLDEDSGITNVRISISPFTVEIGSIGQADFDPAAVRWSAALSAGGRSIVGSPDGSSIGASTDVVTVFGGTAANPQVVGASVSLPTISGGYDNEITTGIASTIAGGAHHVVNTSDGHAFIGGGSTQAVRGGYGIAAGGLSNAAESDYSVVVGGRSNIAGDAANRTTKRDQFVGAGFSNEAEGDKAVVVGGNNQTADAPYSSIVGGDGNTIQAAADWGSCGGGANNLISEDYGTIPGGSGARTTMHGQMSWAGGFFATNGDAQASSLVARCTTTNATQTEMFLDGATATKRLVLPSDTTWAFRITVVARRTDVDDESAGYTFEGVIDRNAGVATTALVGSVTSVVLAEDTVAWAVAVDADTTNGSLRIRVTGEAAKTIRWVARVDLTCVSG